MDTSSPPPRKENTSQPLDLARESRLDLVREDRLNLSRESRHDISRDGRLDLSRESPLDLEQDNCSLDLRLGDRSRERRPTSPRSPSRYTSPHLLEEHPDDQPLSLTIRDRGKNAGPRPVQAMRLRHFLFPFRIVWDLDEF